MNWEETERGFKAGPYELVSAGDRWSAYFNDSLFGARLLAPDLDLFGARAVCCAHEDGEWEAAQWKRRRLFMLGESALFDLRNLLESEGIDVWQWNSRDVMVTCSHVLLAAPCTAEAAADWAYAVGFGKNTAVLWEGEGESPYKRGGHTLTFSSVGGVLLWLRGFTTRSRAEK